MSKKSKSTKKVAAKAAEPKAKKVHPADLPREEAIAKATEFWATLHRGGADYDKAEGLKTLAEARARAAEMVAAAGKGARKPLIHAIYGGAAILVPNSYDPDKPAPKAAPAESAERPMGTTPAKRKTAKAEKPERKGRTAKTAQGDGARAGSKTETVLAMLKKGKHTRAEIVAATEWQVDLTALCKRKGLKLKKSAEGVLSVS